MLVVDVGFYVPISFPHRNIVDDTRAALLFLAGEIGDFTNENCALKRGFLASAIAWLC